MSRPSFIAGIIKYEVLPQTEQRALIQLSQRGDAAACRKICEHNLRFVLKVAMKFQGSGLPLEDLVNEGVIGLREAVMRFDLTMKFQFISYAVWWVRQSILRALDSRTRLIRISSYQEAAIKKLRALPMEQLIGGDYAIPEEEFRRKGFPSYTLEANRATVVSSLDSPLTPEGGDSISFLPSNLPSPDDWTERRQEADRLRRLVHTLAPRERRVIGLLFGLETGRPAILEEVGDLLGMSKERVRQIRNGALEKLRRKAGRWADGAQRPEPASGEGSP